MNFILERELELKEGIFLSLLIFFMILKILGFILYINGICIGYVGFGCVYFLYEEV